MSECQEENAVSGSETVAVEITGRTTFGGTAFIWEHKVNWDYSYCMGNWSYWNDTVDSTDIDVRNKFTDMMVNYHGVHSEDDDMGDDEEQFTSYRQAKYNSTLPFAGTTANYYPTSEILVNGIGQHEIITAEEK